MGERVRGRERGGRKGGGEREGGSGQRIQKDTKRLTDKYISISTKVWFILCTISVYTHTTANRQVQILRKMNATGISINL